MAKNVILTSATSFKPKAGSHMQKHPDGDSRNFARVSRILWNSSCRPAPCIELLEYGVYTAFLSFLTKKMTLKCTYTAIASHSPCHYVGAHAFVVRGRNTTP